SCDHHKVNCRNGLRHFSEDSFLPRTFREGVDAMSRNELSQIQALEAVGAKIIRFLITPAANSQGNECRSAAGVPQATDGHGLNTDKEQKKAIDYRLPDPYRTPSLLLSVEIRVDPWLLCPPSILDPQS